jgi:hypothetical protein
MERKIFWSVKARRKDGDIMIPDTMGAKVTSLSRETAFAGIKVRISCGKKDARRWADLAPESEEFLVWMYDGSGMVKEHWLIDSAKISHVFIEEAISEEMDSDPSCPFGDYLHFVVQGVFKLQPL